MSAEPTCRCLVCKDASVVWVRALALPRGFRIFAGRTLHHNPDDHAFVEIVCLHCDGRPQGERSET